MDCRINFLKRDSPVIEFRVPGRTASPWKVLGDLVDFHGCDPIDEVPKIRNVTNYHFYSMVLGNEDGQREFYVKADSFSSSFVVRNSAVLEARRLARPRRSYINIISPF